MRKIALRSALLLGLLALASLAGCKQGVGERCQIDSDCEDGLVCGNNKVCSENVGQDQVDGGGPADASPFDANDDDAGADAGAQ